MSNIIQWAGDLDFTEMEHRAKTFLKSSHRFTYCCNGQPCDHYMACLEYHVFIEKKDDEPFKRFIETNGNCKDITLAMEVKTQNTSNLLSKCYLPSDRRSLPKNIF